MKLNISLILLSFFFTLSLSSCKMTEKKQPVQQNSLAVVTAPQPFPPNHIIVVAQILEDPQKQGSRYITIAKIKSIKQRGSGFHYPLQKGDTIKIYSPVAPDFSAGQKNKLELNVQEKLGDKVIYTLIKTL